MSNSDKNKTHKPRENQYLRKARIAREKTFFSRKNTIRLMVSSILFCGAFVIWAGQTGLEGDGPLVTLFHFILMIFLVILLAIGGAMLIFIIRKLRPRPKNLFLDSTSNNPQNDRENSDH